MYEKLEKKRNTITSKLMKISNSTFLAKIIKPPLRICIFWTYWEKTSQIATVPGGPGWAGPGRFITDIDYIFKKKHFLFTSITKKINSLRDITLFCCSIWLWKVALDCELAPGCSQLYSVNHLNTRRITKQMQFHWMLLIFISQKHKISSCL